MSSGRLKSINAMDQIHQSPMAAKKLGLMLGNQGVGDFFQIAVHYKIQLVQGEVDTVVGHAALGIVVGTDALAAVAAADEGFAFGGFFGLGFAFCASFKRAARTFIACALLACWLRPSWHSTTIPVGKWVMRTAESVLLMC